MKEVKMKQERWDGITAVVAILAIAAIEVAALFNGMNGYMLTASVSAVAGIGGYTAGILGGHKSNRQSGGRA